MVYLTLDKTLKNPLYKQIVEYLESKISYAQQIVYQSIRHKYLDDTNIIVNGEVDKKYFN